MLVGVTESTAQARLFAILAAGEELAHECASVQSELTDAPRSRRFFRLQARQERMHRQVFQAATLWLAPRGVQAAASCPAFRQYRRQLLAALRRGDMGESLVAQQIVLEGLGEVVLGHIEEGMRDRQAGFQSLRRILLRQEHAHHRFGVHELERLSRAEVLSQRRLREHVQEYLLLADRLLDEHAACFGYFDEDPRAYSLEVRSQLPDWLTASTS